MCRILEGVQNEIGSSRLFPGLPLYCEGRRRPLMRGVVHLLTLLAMPALTYRVHRRVGRAGRPSVIVLGVCSAVTFGASALFHLVRWRSERWEVLAQKLDHAAIHLLAAGSYVPLTMTLTAPLRAATLASSWCSAALGVALTFGGYNGSLSKVITALCVLPALPHLHLAREAAAVLALYGGALCMYSTDRPRLMPDVFGSHEALHLVVSAATFWTFSIAERTLTTSPTAA